MKNELKDNQPFQKILGKYLTLLKRHLKTLKKSLEKAVAQKQECLLGEREKKEALLLQSNLYKKPIGEEIVLEDYETGEFVKIKLNPRFKPHEEVAKRFKRAKKLIKGLPFAIEEVKKREEELFKWSFAREEFEKIDSEDSLEAFLQKFPLKSPQEKISQDKKVPEKPYIEKVLENKDVIWVGKSSAKNDLLTFQYAHGNDYWLHVAEGAGAHVVIHRPKEPLSNETLNEALKLAYLHSKKKLSGSCEIVMTKVKHVKKIGKKAGLVQIANEKKIFYSSSMKR